MDQVRPVFHYLHNEAHGRVLSGSPTEGFLSVVVLGKKYNVPFDYRDKRTLVLFDGSIPWGGLPRQGKAIRLEESLIPPVHHAQVRNSEPWEERPGYRYSPRVGSETMVHVSASRYLLLLPKGIAIVRRFRDRSLSPQFVIIDVDPKRSELVVFRTTKH